MNYYLRRWLGRPEPPPKSAPPPASPTIDRLLRLLQYGLEWTVTEFRLTHVRGLSFWIANGQSNLHVRDPFYLELSPEQQRRLWPDVQRMMDLKRAATLVDLAKLLDQA